MCLSCILWSTILPPKYGILILINRVLLYDRRCDFDLSMQAIYCTLMAIYVGMHKLNYTGNNIEKMCFHLNMSEELN